MCFGSTFIKLPNALCTDILNRTHDSLDEEIGRCRDGMKGKLNHLREVEGKSAAAGFDLHALSNDELKSMKTLV